MPEMSYRLLHFAGILLTFMALGAMVMHARQGEQAVAKARKFAAMFHGIGLMIVLVAGFGLIAKVDGVEFKSPYIIGKLIIWFILGGMGALILKAPKLATLCWFVTVALGVAAGYLIWAKPTFG